VPKRFFREKKGTGRFPKLLTSDKMSIPISYSSIMIKGGEKGDPGRVGPLLSSGEGKKRREEDRSLLKESVSVMEKRGG